ncbi:hypothetical protein FGO68_gene12211 [Halteria grandinella]|uniref:Uncharacterized protein n=1 Tax=Halteria grandinella TaxID=5974 RepID=A0A8J8NJ88_HALGN|nr:hypothetical protein FGO68_gene12211 [Halteria grandinella]
MNSAEIPVTIPSPLVLKLVMLGYHGVGKTSFLSMFVDKVFSNKSIIGVDFKIHKVVKEGRECKYQIWDPSGGEKFRTFAKMYLRNAHGFLIFVDLSINTPVNEQVDHWMQEIQDYSSPNVCKILIGSKCDLPQLISDESCEKYAQSYNMVYFKTSAKEDVNVTDSMESIMDEVFQKVKDEYFQKIQLQQRQANPNEQNGACC